MTLAGCGWPMMLLVLRCTTKTTQTTSSCMTCLALVYTYLVDYKGKYDMRTVTLYPRLPHSTVTTPGSYRTWTIVPRGRNADTATYACTTDYKSQAYYKGHIDHYVHDIEYLRFLMRPISMVARGTFVEMDKSQCTPIDIPLDIGVAHMDYIVGYVAAKMSLDGLRVQWDMCTLTVQCGAVSNVP